MRTLLSGLGVCAALVMLGVSGAMNYLFLSSLGKTELEGQVLGGASAAADLLKALLPFFIASAWRARRIVASIAGALVFVFFSGFSLMSAIGFAADNRGVITEARGEITAKHDSARRELQDAETKLAALPVRRPPSVVTEDIARHTQNARWSRTRACADATEAHSRSFCEQYFTLRAELAAGSEGKRLTGIIAGLKSALARLRDSGAGQDRDPQVALLSRILGQPHDRVRLALIVVVALLVETGSSLGLFLASGHSDFARRRQTPPGGTPSPQSGSIEEFCLEALTPSEKGGMAVKQLWQAYQSWCAGKGATPLDAKAFAAGFDRLAKGIGLAKSRGVYAGIVLREKPRT